MKLYFAPGACSLAVHIALREVGIAFEAHQVDLATHTLTEGGGNYFEISPRGYVPLLEFDDGSRHTEGAALLQHVAGLDGSHALIGAPGSRRRLEVTEWLAFVSTELHKTFSPWLWHKETADSTKRDAKLKLAARFGEMERHLAAREFLAGDYSVADAYGFTIVNWSHFLGIPLSDFPHLRAWMDRVSGRPAVQQALRAEGLLKD